MDKPGNVYTQTKASTWIGHLNDSTHSRMPAHIKGSVALLRNTRVGIAPASCIPGVTVRAVLAVLARIVWRDSIQ